MAYTRVRLHRAHKGWGRCGDTKPTPANMKQEAGMNPIELVPWAFWIGVSLLILTAPVAVFVAAISIARGKV